MHQIMDLLTLRHDFNSLAQGRAVLQRLVNEIVNFCCSNMSALLNLEIDISINLYVLRILNYESDKNIIQYIINII